MTVFAKCPPSFNCYTVLMIQAWAAWDSMAHHKDWFSFTKTKHFKLTAVN